MVAIKIRSIKNRLNETGNLLRNDKLEVAYSIFNKLFLGNTPNVMTNKRRDDSMETKIDKNYNAPVWRHFYVNFILYPGIYKMKFGCTYQYRLSVIVS